MILLGDKVREVQVACQNVIGLLPESLVLPAFLSRANATRVDPIWTPAFEAISAGRRGLSLWRSTVRILELIVSVIGTGMLPSRSRLGLEAASISDCRSPDFPRLQDQQAVARLSIASVPPSATESLWSTSRGTSGAPCPQYWQVNLSLSRTCQRSLYQPLRLFLGAFNFALPVYHITVSSITGSKDGFKARGLK